MTNDVLTVSPSTQSETLDTETLTARDVIGLAAELIDKNGKCEGRYSDLEDRYCTIGALRKVVGSRVDMAAGMYGEHEHPLVLEAINLIDNAVTVANPYPFWTAGARVAVGWSDQNDKETVVNKLREIASGE